jgi:arabinan endo-1,5-alpha-L-arabinosidase
MNAHQWQRRLTAAALILALLIVPAGVAARPTQDGTRTYRNPLSIPISGDGRVESCADPTVIYGQEHEGLWYMYCTTDPLNDQDRNASGDFNFHLIPMFSSTDLVNWTYQGDAFSARPAYAVPNAGLWAPEIKYYPETGQYHLYYTVTDTTFPGGGSAIGVATSDSPLGPWIYQPAPVVEPHPADCCPGSRRWVFDPEVLRTAGPDYIYYGSYFGGISVRVLSEDGLASDPASQTLVTIANRYEGPEVVFNNGYYYLFVSATDCCRGPLTGYSVFAGRSSSPVGPFVDREGVSLLAGRVGGTPVISMNGNRWVGTGHNTVFRDFDGQWWTIYHAVDRFDPYFEGAVGFTKRPVLLDALDWIDGWPTVRGGMWASDTPQHAPAAQPGDKTNYKTKLVKQDQPGQLIANRSDEFDGITLGSQWTWVRPPDPATYGLTGSAFRFDTQAADLFESSNNASVLLEDTPNGNYIVETKVRLNLPPEGCCFNFVQAGLVIYGNDDNFVKLAHVSIWETRQTEFAKELFPVPAGYPRYGNTVVGPPDESTFLRIVKRTVGGDEHYTAYTSRDGQHWVRGGTWTHDLGNQARIGLVSMGGAGFVAEFDYVRVYRLDG